MAGKKRMKHYPLELKLEAMRMFYEERKTRKEITEALGIRDRDRVMKWLSTDMCVVVIHPTQPTCLYRCPAGSCVSLTP